jgi:hypothetical protein
MLLCYGVSELPLTLETIEMLQSTCAEPTFPSNALEILYHIWKCVPFLLIFVIKNWIQQILSSVEQQFIDSRYFERKQCLCSLLSSSPRRNLCCLTFENGGSTFIRNVGNGTLALCVTTLKTWILKSRMEYIYWPYVDGLNVVSLYLASKRVLVAFCVNIHSRNRQKIRINLDFFF